MGLFSKRAARGGNATRAFFATDLHSSEICFRKLLGTPAAYGVDTVIMGGDCTGKMLIPIVELADGSGHRLEWAGEFGILAGDEELEAAERRVRAAGQYPIRITEADAEALQGDSVRLRRTFSEQMLAIVAAWAQLAEERLAESGTHVVMTPGNDDEFEVDDVLRRSSFVDAAEGRITRIGDHEMLSVGWSNPTPWNTPRECSEEELAAKIDGLADQIEDMDRAIFNIHVPPHGTGLDNAPKLDAGLKPVQGGTVMTPVGSVAVREAIERHQPMLSLHGHIHESRGVQRLGRTLCINPGSVYGEGILQGVIVELDSDRVRYQLTDG